MMDKKKRRRIETGAGIVFCGLAVLYLFIVLVISLPYRQELGTLAQVDFVTGQELETEAGKTIQGHFTDNIDEGEQVFFRILNLEVHVFQNNKEIYSYGMPGSYPAIFRSGGNLWSGFKSPGISANDEITIELLNSYSHNWPKAYDSFLNQIYTGDKGVLLEQMVRKHFPVLCLGTFVLIMGVGMLIVVCALRLIKVSIPQASLKGAFYTLLSGIWLFCDYDILSLVIPYPMLNGALLMISQLLLPPLFAGYIYDFMESRAAKWMKALMYFSWLLPICYIGLQLLGICDGYEFQNGYMIALTFITAVILICVLYEKHVYKKEASAILTGVLFLVCFLLAELLNYLYPVFPAGLFYGIGFALFGAWQLMTIMCRAKTEMENAKRVKELENELLQNRITMMISQIQPHFIFNTLNAIGTVCLTEPEKADEAITQFSDYLRANIMLLEGKQMISFSDELNHIDNYVKMEQLRFGDKIRFKKELSITGFRVPLLSIQPIVENAVKHGISKRVDGGTVTLSTREWDNYIELAVTDDGIGFCMEEAMQNEKSVGMKNITARLELLAEAEVDIKSEPGVGTRVTVMLPKKVVEDTDDEDSLRG